jgi:ABC-type amino acid transport substrate-binding protein
MDLWSGIADRLGYRYEIRQLQIGELFDALEKNEIDLAVAALTVTAEREARVDFTQPYFNTGISIATKGNLRTGSWLTVAKRLFSIDFLIVVSILLIVLLTVGFVVWFLERRHQQSTFEKQPGKGLISGLWWAAVTMTTVGYGDKVPVTTQGRIVGMVWIFASLILISSFTAAITAALTLGELDSRVQHLVDLHGSSVGTVEGSSGESVAHALGLPSQSYENAEAGMRALAAGRINAFIHDQAILRYLVSDRFGGRLHVLDRTFDHQSYAIALPHDSPMYEQINMELLRMVNSAEWNDIIERYIKD